MAPMEASSASSGESSLARNASTRLLASSIHGVVISGTVLRRPWLCSADRALCTLHGVHLTELTTPALIVEHHVLDGNLAAMSEALPGTRLRPHVKAHKCTQLAARQASLGHHTFTCATIREMEGMAGAGLGDDLL